MGNRGRSLTIAVGLAGGLVVSAPAAAEMGLSPAGPGAFYGSLLGGYINSDGTATPGFSVDSFPASFPTFFFEAEHGSFIGGKAGYVFGSPGPFAVTNLRIEAGFAATHFEADEETAAQTAILSINSNVAQGGQVSTSVQSRKIDDWFATIKGDHEITPEFGAAVGIELFYRDSTDRTITTTDDGDLRSHDVDGSFAGVMAVVQPEYVLTPNLSFVADLGLGLYHVEADALSTDNIIAPFTFFDSDDKIGFRARAQGGLKLKPTDAIVLTLFGGIDWWSNVPVAGQQPFFAFSSVGPNDFPEVQFNDLVELTAGLSLTIALNGQ